MHIYPEVLNQQTLGDDQEQSMNVSTLRFKRNNKVIDAVKQAGIFNENSEEEANDDSPFKVVNGKLKGLSPFEE